MALGEDPYLDPRTGVLANKVGATTWEQLQTAETDLVSARALELIERPIGGNFDLSHLRARINRRLRNAFNPNRHPPAS